MTLHTHLWKIPYLSPGQMLDVDPLDAIEVSGKPLFRVCNTYKGGGGYDHFPDLSEKYFGKRHSKQFIVQLFGCNLDCPYCYVTREGVWGAPVQWSTEQIIKLYASQRNHYDYTVLHLMGGAPAIQLHHWPELIAAFQKAFPQDVFHSDFMLSESVYTVQRLEVVAKPNCLYAVNIKGTNAKEYELNTRKPFNLYRQIHNLTLLEACQVPYYITFTGLPQSSIDYFWKVLAPQSLAPSILQRRKEESYAIDLIEYAALPHVDDVAWGV